MKRAALLATLTLVALIGLDLRAQDTEGVAPVVAVLAPTVHPALPDRSDDFWFVPQTFAGDTNGRADSPAGKFARGARLIDAGDFAGAQSASKNAKIWAYTTLIVGAVLVGLGLLGSAMK